jgi:hypothetical protein
MARDRAPGGGGCATLVGMTKSRSVLTPRLPRASRCSHFGAKWLLLLELAKGFEPRSQPQSGRDRQPARLQPGRHLAQRQFRHSRDHRLGDGLLRAPADVGDRLRPAGPADDDVVAQLHLRQRRGLARPHHLGAVRRLPQFDPAARHPGGVQGRGVGEFRPYHRKFEPDLLDHRRAARRTPRDPDRRPALHDDRDELGQAHDRGRARRRRARLQAALAGEVQHRPAGD